jgi:hypothetical protein
MSAPLGSISRVICVNAAPVGGAAWTMATPLVRPGIGVRTKVSGVKRKWSRRFALRVWPRLCIGDDSMRTGSGNCKGFDAKGAKRGATFREGRLMLVGMEMEQEIEDGGEGGFYVFYADVFAGLVGEAAGGAEEEHGGGDGGGEDHGVVAGAGEDGLGVESGSLGGLVELEREVAIHGDGALLGLNDGVDAHAAEGSGGLGFGEQVGNGGVAGFVLGVADVEGSFDGARNDVDGAGKGSDAAYGGD